MKRDTDTGRRRILKISGLTAAAWASGRPVLLALEKNEGSGEVSPPEDLMREHGVLRRILLIYGNLIQRVDAGGDMPWDKLSDAAQIVRTFIEDYHEKLEENHIFPAMHKANRLTDLVGILDKQHKAGRHVTAAIQKTTEKKSKDRTDHQTLRQGLASFIRMYEPHAAREDTVLFPALHSVWSEREFKRMGDVFEKEEDRLFGDHGFEKIVDRVAGIEKTLGIYDLSRFTPS